MTGDTPILETLQLLAWTPAGQLALTCPLGGRTLALSQRDDGDVEVPALSAPLFVRPGEASAELSRPDAGGEAKCLLKVGEPQSFASLTWLLAKASAAAAEASVASPSAGPGSPDAAAPELLLADAAAWVTRPMANIAELKNELKEFLRMMVTRAHAVSGMLVLAEGEGFSLVSSCGLAPKDAQRLWEKMPHSLVEDVVRSKARMLLPEELRRQQPSGDSTVFVRGVRSVAGFPVLAEGRLVAVFYLGFDNLLRRLSLELQKAVEAAADLLGIVLQRAHLREQIEALKLKAAAAPTASLPAGRLMVGASPKLVEVYHLLARLAPVDVATLILGETGTGKELAAKELHRMSARGKGPFVVVNAAALPESLIESELFGHKKGSFTGALTDRVGLIEQASGGTLFIDEIGELPLPMQAKLLRVLQERAVTRIGETQPRDVDFRVVSATHRPLAEMVAAGRFREDLYYRLAGATISMPALRDRPEDLVTLASYFRQQFAERHGLADKEWSAEALLALERCAWPGNIREMENVVARAFVMAEGPVIRARDLGFAGAPSEEAAGPAPEQTLNDARDAWTKGFLMRALERHKGRRLDTAKALGIGERTLFRYLDQLGIGEP